MSHWKNYFILRVVGFLRLFQGCGKSNHFLIVSTTGLGDSLWATPAIRALRKAYPNSYIGCLTSRMGGEVFKSNPHLNEVLIFNHTLSLLKLYFQLKKRKIGTVLLFHASQRAMLPLCSVIGASRRIGTQGLQKELDILLTDACSGEKSHEIERRLEVVKQVGAYPDTYELDFIIEEAHRQHAKKLAFEPFIIGIHPGAKDVYKQWPVSHFIQVAQKLKEKLGCTILITGSLSEKKLVETICAEVKGARAIIEPLKIMAAVLEKLTLFITNDTGPLHLALAMQTPTLALFTPTNPAVCGPYRTSSSAQVIQAPATCFPCLKKKCQDAFCMRQIGPNEVIQAALEKIKVSI